MQEIGVASEAMVGEGVRIGPSCEEVACNDSCDCANKSEYRSPWQRSSRGPGPQALPVTHLALPTVLKRASRRLVRERRNAGCSCFFLCGQVIGADESQCDCCHLDFAAFWCYDDVGRPVKEEQLLARHVLARAKTRLNLCTTSWIALLWSWQKPTRMLGKPNCGTFDETWAPSAVCLIPGN